MKFNIGKFIDTFNVQFRTVLNASQEHGIEFLLSAIGRDDWTDYYQVAYFLATIKWETGHTFEPVTERGPSVGAEKYFNDKYNGRMGNGKLSNDGFTYRGRGYVQLTGRDNYQKFSGIVNKPLLMTPDLAKSPETAYQIAAIGMKRGLFTGASLGHFIRIPARDFEHARRIVNGLDHALDIMEIANKICVCCEASMATVSVPVVGGLDDPKPIS